jgi:hypothetical protein
MVEVHLNGLSASTVITSGFSTPSRLAKTRHSHLKIPSLFTEIATNSDSSTAALVLFNDGRIQASTLAVISFCIQLPLRLQPTALRKFAISSCRRRLFLYKWPPPPW